MGTKVQCESYLLGYSSIRKLNEDSSSSWSAYYEDRTLNEHLYNGSMSRPEYSGYDKEMLKRTILEHEATFRKQVYELHRLYRTQKDLMDELKTQELYKLPFQSAISQSYVFSSGRKTWQMPHFDKDHVADTEDVKPSLDLLKENYMQFSQLPRKNGVSLQNGELLDPKLNGRPKQIIDLELPADAYIDAEKSCQRENEQISKLLCRVTEVSSITCDIEHENDVKLTLGASESHGKVSLNSDSVRQNGQSILSLGSKRQSNFSSDHFLTGSTNPEEVHGRQLPIRSNQNFLSRDFFTDKNRDEGACSNFFDADKGKGRQEWPSFYYDNGRNGNRVNSITQGLSSVTPPILSEPSELKVKREHCVSSYNHQKGSPFVDLNRTAPTSSQAPGPLSVTPLLEGTSCASPVAPIRGRPPRAVTHIPIAVQALPCFPVSELQTSRGRKCKQSIQNSTDGSFNSCPRGGIELSSSQNGLRQDLWSDSSSSTQIKSSSDSSVYEKSEGCASQKFPELQNDARFGMSLPNSTTEGDTNFQREFSFSKKQIDRVQLLGFPICTELQQTAICSSDNGIKTVLSEAGTAAGKNVRENIIDLNTLEISTEDEEVKHEIELEDPLPSCEAPDALAAAENIVVLSFGLRQQLVPSSCDLLQWFANIVLTHEEDVFESMTLKLEEMKTFEYLPQPQQELESRKDDNATGVSSLLLTKTGRGQLRKRRTKKDFQKDILPGLVSLSKHEVTEDFQAFDCLMRAMGEVWEPTLIRRSTGRKGFVGQGRGRGRGRRLNSTVPTIERRTSPPPMQQPAADPKVEISERGMIGWGRTTRRGTRPRIRPGNTIVAGS